jgi:hypothetical protein
MLYACESVNRKIDVFCGNFVTGKAFALFWKNGAKDFIFHRFSYQGHKYRGAESLAP